MSDYSWREAGAITLAGASVAFDILATAPRVDARELNVALSVACILGALVLVLWPVKNTLSLTGRRGLYPNPAEPSGLTWLVLKEARAVMLAAQVEAQDRWAVVSIRHLDRVKTGMAGVLVYSPVEHAVVMVCRGTQVKLIAPRPLSDFGLRPPRPIHFLTKAETYQARGVALGAAL